MFSPSDCKIRCAHDDEQPIGWASADSRSYQMTPAALAAQCSGPEGVHDVMQKAISLAASAAAASSADGRPRSVALSLGPFGSTLSPGQEYAGVYPPPYGPGPSGSGPSNAAAQEEALLAFHLQRLRAFSATPAFATVRWLAFETVPNLAEVRAIRRAVGAWRSERRAGESNAGAAPQFWIASAFPKGSLGEAPNGPHGVSEWLDALLGGVGGVGGDEAAPVPDGIGFNCTNPAYLEHLLDEVDARVPAETRSRLTLVVYPDGGCVYDVVTRTWTEREGSADGWARALVDVVKGRTGWRGMLLGGCCKTGPDEIAALRREVDALRRGA